MNEHISSVFERIKKPPGRQSFSLKKELILGIIPLIELDQASWHDKSNGAIKVIGVRTAVNMN
jgi:hypothetical protein